MTNNATCPDCGGNGMLTINSKPPIFCDTCNGMGEVEAECDRCKQLEAEAAAAVKDLKQACVFGNSCAFCKDDRSSPRCNHNDKSQCWQWHGYEQAGKDLLERVQGLEAVIDLLRQKKQICAEWQDRGDEPPSKEFVEAIYTIKELDRRIDFAVAALEGGAE